jgi:hypothetical protein
MEYGISENLSASDRAAVRIIFCSSERTGTTVCPKDTFVRSGGGGGVGVNIENVVLINNQKAKQDGQLVVWGQ